MVNANQLIGQQRKIKIEDIIREHDQAITLHNTALRQLIKVIGENPDVFQESDAKTELETAYNSIIKQEEEIAKAAAKVEKDKETLVKKRVKKK